MTGTLDTFINPNYKFGEFPGMIYAFFETEQTIILFPFFLIVSGILIGSYLNKEWKEEQREDLLGRGFKHADGDQTYGAAHFLRPDEYADAAQIRKLADCKGIILGQLKDNGEECVDFNPYEGRINSHMLAIGRSGGGKTFTFVLSYILQSVKRRHSIIITDPKGDLYMQCAGYLRDNGYVVRTLNLKDPSKSDGWDMLAALEGPRLEENVAIFSHTLAVNMSEESGGIFMDGGEALINAIILKTLLDPNNGPEDKKITTAYQMLLNPDGMAYLDTVFADENITEAEKPAQLAYFTFKNSSPNLLGNIVTHVTVGLKLFQRKDICDMFTTPGIDMTLPGKQPCAYFIQFPDVHTTYSFLTALFFSMLFTYLTDYADLIEDKSIGKKMGKLLTPVDFLLDEFPSIGTLPDWDSKMAVMRSRKINIVMIIQDYPQLVKRYKESWKTIVNNCGCILTLGINEPDDTASWIAARCGVATVEVTSSSTHSVAGQKKDQLIENMSQGLGKRPLLNVDEVCTLDRDGSLLIITDHGAVYVHKFPYLLFPDSQKLYDTLPSDIIDLSNKRERKIFEDAEKAYLEEYWSCHEMHPDLNISDMSDAMYYNRPDGPVKVAFEVIALDISNLFKSFFKLFKRQKTEKYEPSKRKKSDSQTYHFESAEKEAFRTFYQNYKDNYEVNQLSEGSEISIDSDSNAEFDFDIDDSNVSIKSSDNGPFEDSKSDFEFDEDDDEEDNELISKKSETKVKPAPALEYREKSESVNLNQSKSNNGKNNLKQQSSEDRQKAINEKALNKKRNSKKPEINLMNIKTDSGDMLTPFKR